MPGCRPRSTPVGQDHIGQFGAPLGDGAGFVERDNIHRRQSLQRVALAEKHTISAARPVPTMIEVGVASPMAQGQAMMRTETPGHKRVGQGGRGARPAARPETVNAASAMTAGTNHSVIRSTRPWIGNLAPCACSTMRMICASVVSAQTPCGAELEAAGAVDGAAGDRIALGLGDGNRLSGDHALVDMGAALRDVPIHRNAFAGTHNEDVAGADPFDGDVLLRLPVH